MAQPTVEPIILFNAELKRALSRAVKDEALLKAGRWFSQLQSSPAVLVDFLNGVQAALERLENEADVRQRLLERSSVETAELARKLEDRARSLEEALAAREAAHQDLLKVRERLSNQEKLASIGTLAAGIAHEINTPTQFVGDNLSFLNDAFRDLLGILDGLLEGREGWQAPEGTMELDFLREEIPGALQQSQEGLERVARIVRSVKEFSHPGSTGKVAVDLNRAIQSTLTVCRNEWKYVAEVETDLDPHLPLVPCVPGEVNQVLLNLVVNAAQAIEDRRQRRPEEQLSGQILVCTRREEGVAHVRIRDNGCGISEEHAARIFDPFFTTKEVGRGTGQGLAIAQSVIKAHGGELSFSSQPGHGTEFHIFLPLTGSPT